MTIEQKNIITELRRTGVGYAAIANRLGISKETVKTFCRRNGLNAAVPSIPETTDGCRNCGKSIEQKPNVKKKRFCCTECRIQWWKTHPECINQKAIYPFQCAHCGKEFTAYGNAKRKYCCHECYIADRFGSHQ